MSSAEHTPRQPLNLNSFICTVCVVFLVAYNIASGPAGASRDQNPVIARIAEEQRQLAAHQRQEDARMDGLVADVRDMRANWKSVAGDLQWLRAWIQSGGRQH